MALDSYEKSQKEGHHNMLLHCNRNIRTYLSYLGLVVITAIFLTIPANRVYASANTESNAEATTEAVTLTPPEKPSISGTYTKKGIKLTWKKVKNATTYYIYRLNSKKKYEQIGETSSLSYTDKTVKKDTYYTYKVVAAYSSEGQEARSSYSKACKVLASTINPSKKMVAITYDDGPGPYTKKIVNCLKKNNGAATFFVVGENVSRYRSSVKAAYKNGCEIGNHSWNHSNLASLSSSQIKSQMSRTDAQIKKATGKKATLMRTPYGSCGGAVRRSVGKPIILWSIDTLDWKTRSKSKTISAVMNHVKDGDIILMHDIHKPTMQASLEIIPRLRKKGYQLVTVSQLAKYRGYKLKKGTTYSSLRKKK